MNTRESDTMLWLHNKLGSSTDTWPEGSISDLLNTQILTNIKNCFVHLETQVKLKLLLSFIHIPPRNLRTFFAELNEILLLAKQDSEPWVSVLGEILIAFPTNEILNSSIRIGDNGRLFSSLVNDLKNLMNKYSRSEKFPLDWCYFNKKVFINVAGRHVVVPTHFTLRRVPKSSILRENLLKRSGRTVSLKVNYDPTDFMPSDIRTDSKPSRCKLRVVPCSEISSMPLVVQLKPIDQKDVGIKLLDFKDQPLQKKKKKSLQGESTQSIGEFVSVPDHALDLHASSFLYTHSTSLYPQCCKP